MIRSNVDLPHPDGPTIVMSSPTLGASSTMNETSWSATFGAWIDPNFLVTALKETTSGTRAELSAPWPAAPALGAGLAEACGLAAASSGTLTGLGAGSAMVINQSCGTG